MKREKKLQKIEEISNLLQENSSVVIFSYGKITHQGLEKIRRGLEKVGGKIKVVKNTFFKKALNKTANKNKTLYDLKNEIKELKGNTALILLKEEWSKILSEFNKLIKGNEEFQYKAALLKNIVYPQEKVRYIASLPPKEVLLGKIIGSMKAPISKLTTSLKYNTSKFVYILKVKSSQNTN